MRVVIDTDVGTDVDDLWTLAMVPALAEVDLAAVTTVYGDVALRARIAADAVTRMGLDAPVHAGCADPLSGKEVMWAGHEGAGLPATPEGRVADSHAVDALIALAAAHPGTLHVVAIGPLTNVATAILRDPDFGPNLAGLTVMGGEMGHRYPEHNFSSDAVATWVVLRSGVPTTVMPLDQTLRVRFDRDDVTAMASAHALGSLLLDESERFWSWLTERIPGAPGGASSPHDPLALLALAEPDWFTLGGQHLAVHGAGESAGAVAGSRDPGSSVRVVTDYDADAVHDRLVALLTS